MLLILLLSLPHFEFPVGVSAEVDLKPGYPNTFSCRTAVVFLFARSQKAPRRRSIATQEETLCLAISFVQWHSCIALITHARSPFPLVTSDGALLPRPGPRPLPHALICLPRALCYFFFLPKLHPPATGAARQIQPLAYVARCRSPAGLSGERDCYQTQLIVESMCKPLEACENVTSPPPPARLSRSYAAPARHGSAGEHSAVGVRRSGRACVRHR